MREASACLTFLPERVSGRGTVRRSRMVEGCTLACAQGDETENPVQMSQNINRRNTKGDNAAFGHPGVARGIPRWSVSPAMRLAVDLDAKLGRVAIEVERIVARRVLLSPIMTSAAAAQLLPEQHLGQRQFMAQLARSVPSFAGSPDHRACSPKRRANPSTMLRMVPLPETSSGRN
ncbi:hypothetical protein HMP06_1481 [Sphingomonas sp. HMP6]|nr:hypothetical protein HMP06_1481 [Sphingomonas sp. HMP6]